MKATYDLSKAKRGLAKDARGKAHITIYLDDDVQAYFRDACSRDSGTAQFPH